MRVIATTVVRESIRGKQRTGYIYDVDWDSRQVVRRVPIPEPQFPESDDNPRGGVRGGRGVAPTRQGIVVANYDTLHVYDEDWNPLESFSHPLFVGIHEIDWDGEHVWLAATGLDAVLKATLEGQVEAAWDPHADSGIEGFPLRRRPHPLDGSVDYRIREAPLLNQCHLNGVARNDGTLVVNCGFVRRRKSLPARTMRRVRRRLGLKKREEARSGGRSLVLRVEGSGDAKRLLQLDEHDFPTHNGQLIDDGVLAVNDSTNNTLRVYDLDESGPRERVHLEIPGTWLRGLEPAGHDRVLVGSAPATLLLADIRNGVIEGKVELSTDPHEAVHGLAIAPPPVERR